MKELFDESSLKISKIVTNTYSTSFSMASRLLSPRVRKAIYAIYGFVRYADEIVDSFKGFPQAEMLQEFREEFYRAQKRKISINPVIHAFVKVYDQYQLDLEMVNAFLDSMEMDLSKSNYQSVSTYNTYIYGSADVVGLMCLKVFVNGDSEQYERLKEPSMKLGSAFQKVNFLRDLRDDQDRLNRSYFPTVNFDQLSSEQKNEIIDEIEADFIHAFEGIKNLPFEARLGVYTAYRYYRKLLRKIKKVEASRILEARIRVTNTDKVIIASKAFLRHQFNLI